MSEMKVLSHEANSITGDLFSKVNTRKRQYVDLVISVLDELAHRYKIKSVDTRVATFLLFGMMNWIYNWYNPRKDVDVAGLSNHVTRLFLSGFLGDKALKGGMLKTKREPHLARDVSIWEQ